MGHRSTGRDGFSPLGLFQVWIGNLVWGKLDPCWRTAILNPRELTSFFGALSPPWHVGAFPSPAKDFKRQSHDRARGSTCSSQVQGQSARIQSWLGDSKSRPSPPAASSEHPPVCLPKEQVRAGGGRVTCHGRSGLDRGGDERAQETQANDAGYPSMHVSLSPPARTPHPPRAYPHTHTASSLAPGCVSLSLPAPPAGTPYTPHTPTHPPTPTRRAHTHPPSPHSP